PFPAHPIRDARTWKKYRLLGARCDPAHYVLRLLQSRESNAQCCSLIRRSRESRLSRRNTGWLDIDSCPGAGTIFRFEDKSKPWLSSCVKTGRRGSASHGVSGNRRKTRFSEGDKLPRPVRCSGYGIG